MRAENLTISIPAGCRKRCPYCISNLTWSPTVDKETFWHNLDTALFVAKQSGVSKILLTSKGEPMEERQWVVDLLIQSRDFITELQTNGEALWAEPEYVLTLAAAGLNVLAYSIDHLDALAGFAAASQYARKKGITIRATAILTGAKDYAQDLEGIVRYAKEKWVDQLTLRVPTVPGATIRDTGAEEWIAEHLDADWSGRIVDELGKYPQVRRLNFNNVVVFDVLGVGVVFIPNCVQEFSNDTDIRSLIYHQDGHLYTSWAYPGSRIF